MNILNEYHKLSDIIGETPSSHELIAHSYDLNIYKISFNNHPNIVAKHGTPKLREHFSIENKMLKHLNQLNFLPVPKPIFVDETLYLMEYIDHIPLGHHQSTEPIIAQKIAKLHQIKSEKFGFEYDTIIGPLLQENRFKDNWIEFFRDQRLLNFADQCLAVNRLSTELRLRIEKLAAKLDDLLLNNHQPTLIHGDLWYGNILSEDVNLKAFIDPALYYANPEIELAYVTMHNSLGSDFFTAYQEIIPIDDGFFDLRKDIYNIYPNLVHILLCGSEYTIPIEAVLKRHGC